MQQLRRERGLSQTALAGDDMSPSYVSLIESGRREPTDDVLRVIAERLGSSVHFLRTGEDGEQVAHARLELSFARLAIGNGEAAEALARLGEIAPDGLDPALAADVVLAMAEAHERLGDLEAAIALLEPLARDTLDAGSLIAGAAAANALTGAYLEAGDLLRASEVGAQSLQRLADAGLAGTDEWLRLGATLVWVHIERGDLFYAQQLARELLDVAAEHGSRSGQGALYWNASLAAHERGRVDDAVGLAERALALLGDEGGLRDLPRLRMHLASVLLEGDEPDAGAALRELDRAQESLAGSQLEQAGLARMRGVAQLQLGDVETAAASVEESLQLLGDAPRMETARALVLSGDVAFARDDRRTGRAAYRRAADMLSMMQSNRAAARVWRELGDRLVASGDAKAAAAAYGHALDEAGLRSSTLPAALRTSSV
ncbi:hypothetical protein GCM10028814_17220 [Angustibacter aerolatus]